MTIMLGFLIAVLIIFLMVNLVMLSRRHNRLHCELNKTYAQIEKSRKAFDAQVLDRTAAIRKVNEDLQYEIAERMKSEERLIRQGELLRSAVSVAPMALLATDGNGVVLLSEGKGLSDLGLKHGEVVGKCVFDVYKDGPQILQNFKMALAGEPFNTFIKSSGRVYESWFCPVRDSNGKVARAVVLAVDRGEETENKQ